MFYDTLTAQICVGSSALTEGGQGMTERAMAERSEYVLYCVDLLYLKQLVSNRHAS